MYLNVRTQSTLTYLGPVPIQVSETFTLQSRIATANLLTLSAHALEGYSTCICVSVCLCVCVSVITLLVASFIVHSN